MRKTTSPNWGGHREGSGRFFVPIDRKQIEVRVIPEAMRRLKAQPHQGKALERAILTHLKPLINEGKKIPHQPPRHRDRVRSQVRLSVDACNVLAEVQHKAEVLEWLILTYL